MFYKVYHWYKNRGRTQIQPTKVTPEIKIPVGEITDTGIIGERVVRPDGTTPIYKEVNINGQIQEVDNTKEKETNQTPKATDSVNK